MSKDTPAPKKKVKAPLNGLRILPLGGLGEIGMNCLVLEWEDEILVVDCGLLFSDLDHFGVEFVIPDFSYLIERREKVSGILVTHGHEDHVGAIPFLLKSGVKAPVFASPFSSLLLRERLKEYGLTDRVDLRTFQMGEVINFKHFSVKTASVNHSIVDSAAMIIETPVGRIIHTGDFKIDPAPFIGTAMDLDVFGAAGDQGVLLLMSDSTNVDRHEHSLSENQVYQAFEHLFAAAEGLTLVAMFASNVSRMGQILDLAKKMGKKVALAGRTMEQNVRLGAELGYLNSGDHESVIIPMDSIHRYPRNKIIVLSTGSQGEYRSALIRVSNGEHPLLKLQQGDRVLMSSKFIPGNEKAIGRMINQLFKQGADVLHGAVHSIHASGHATRPELKQMLELCKPRFFLPIHGEYRHLVRHAELAREAGIPPENVMLAVNGDVLDLTRDEFKKVDHIEETRILVEGRDGNDISKLVLRERRQMGEKGIVFALMVRNRETRRIMSGPEIIAKGLTHEQQEAFIIEEAKNVARKVVLKYELELKTGNVEMDLQETVRIELRRFFESSIGRKPIVLPIILDL